MKIYDPRLDSGGALDLLWIVGMVAFSIVVPFIYKRYKRWRGGAVDEQKLEHTFSVMAAFIFFGLPACLLLLYFYGAVAYGAVKLFMRWAGFGSP